MLDSFNKRVVTTLSQWPENNLLVRFAKSVYCAIIEINNGYFSLHAKGLVYTTLVSLVPILAISFSVLKAFGVHNQFSPWLFATLEPLGAKGEEIADYIVSFIDNVDVKLLGILGSLILVYTVLATIAQIEETLNHIWKQTNARNFFARTAYIFGIVFIAPTLVFHLVDLQAGELLSPELELQGSLHDLVISPTGTSSS